MTIKNKITYENKEDFISLPNIEGKNKVVAADMNEIKTVVNNISDLLTETNKGMISIGTTIVWYSDTLPSDNWMICNGQSLEISSYLALYKIIGKKYGGDDTHFKLPNQNYNPEGVDSSLIPSYNYIIRVR